MHVKHPVGPRALAELSQVPLLAFGFVVLPVLGVLHQGCGRIDGHFPTVRVQREGDRRASLAIALDLELLLVLSEGAVPLGYDVAVLRVVNPVRGDENAETIPIVRKKGNRGEGQLRSERPEPARYL